MNPGTSSAIVLLTLLIPFPVTAQTPQHPAAQILSFDIQGINALMSPDTARNKLLQAGFREKGDGKNWGKVPNAVFIRDDIMVGITHLEGKIIAISETRISRGEPYDYSDELARIKLHFGIAADDQRTCIERDYGTRCGFGDSDKKGARFSASLTTQMMFIQAGYQH